MYVRNGEVLNLPLPQTKGKYVINTKDIIKQMKINHPGFTNNTLGQFIGESDWDLAKKCTCINIWENRGASFDIFKKFFENFTKQYGYQCIDENQRVQLLEGRAIKSIRYHGEKTCRVELDNGSEAKNIPTNLAREGVYIQCRKLTMNHEKNYFEYADVS
jgi:hypothetical protein